MTRIVKFYEGDEIPEGAKFLYAKQERSPAPPRYDYGLFWTTVTERWWVRTALYYEVTEEVRAAF